jgi:hypothetical protein
VRRGLAFVSVLVFAPATASAGRTFYGWLYGTEVLPERGAEAASWIAEENDLKDEAHRSSSEWWVSAQVGITDQLELALPVALTWFQGDDTNGPHTSLDRYGAELRYRLVTQDPVDAPPLVPLIRVGVYRLIDEPRDTWSPQADVVVSYQTGIVHVLADLGGYAEISPNNQHFEVRPGAGFSIEAVSQLRFGAEVHAELTLDNGGSWAVVGPNMAWSHGRTWISAMYGIGIYGLRDAPKVQWGIAF